MEYKEAFVENFYNLLGNSEIFEQFYIGAFVLKDKNRLLYIVDGKIHRDNGPAQIIFENHDPYPMIYFTYYRYNSLHCETGPAYVVYNTRLINPVEEAYFLNDSELSKQKWEEQVQTKLYW